MHFFLKLILNLRGSCPFLRVPNLAFVKKKKKEEEEEETKEEKHRV